MMKALGRKAAGERLARMQASPQWVDKGFANVLYRPPPKPREPMPLREFFCPKETRKPLGPLPTVDPRPTLETQPDTGLRVTWLGHSTLLIEIDGVRILTDPVWGNRASPTQRLGPQRFQEVPIELEALPPLDLILLSHDHYDHLDYLTIRELSKAEVPFVAPLGVGAHLEWWGIEPRRITELDWWDRKEVAGGKAAVVATPAQHFSGRTPGMRNRTLWASYVIESRNHKMFFGGDSGMMPGFAEIGDRFGSFDMVCLEIGAYHPAWGDIHLGPTNALAALKDLGGGPLLPIHWGTFDLAVHRWDQPIEVLTRLAKESGADLLTPRIGAPIEPSLQVEDRDAWWRPLAALHKEEAPASEEDSEMDEELTIPTD